MNFKSLSSNEYENIQKQTLRQLNEPKSNLNNFVKKLLNWKN